MDVAFSGCRIENNQVLLKSFGLRGHLALRRQGDARAVENQAVVASHLIHVNDWPFVCQRDGAQHLETQRTLVERVRRTRDVQQHRTSLPDNLADRIALVQLLGPKILVVPNVFTNGDAKLLSAQPKNVLAGRGPGVASFPSHGITPRSRISFLENETTPPKQRGCVRNCPPPALVS